MENNKIKILDIPDVKWGESPAPLLPRSLRLAWRKEVLPSWVCEELHLDLDSTYEDLDSDVWDKISAMSPRLNHHLIFMLRTHLRNVHNLKCFDQNWPTGLRTEDIGWGVRTANRVAWGHNNLDAEHLLDLTYGNLASIEGMGVKSIIDFTATLEGAINYYNNLVNNCGNQVEGSCDFISTLERIGSCQWAEEVFGNDPRFPSVLIGKDDSLSESIDNLLSEPDSLNKIADIPALVQSALQAEKIVDSIDKLSLEEQLISYLRLLSKAKSERLNAIVSRFGWGGEKPITLEACGSLLGVTRERIRQIQKKITNRIPSDQMYMPKLDQAIKILEEYSPITLSDAAKLLTDKEISKVSFHPEGILQAAEILNRPSVLKIIEVKKEKLVVADKDYHLVSLIPRLARKLAGASGASNIFQVLRLLEDKGYQSDEETVIRSLKGHKIFEFLDEDWFWVTDINNPRNRLYNISRKLLSVVQPIDLHTIREGVRRNFRWRASTSGSFKTLLVPPVRIIEKYFIRHPDFIVDNRNVSFSKPLDYRQELGETDRVLTEALRTTPTNLLDRKSLAEYCVKCGINENTFTVYTTYSPILEHVDIDIWKLRGVRVDPAAVTAMREANHLKPREKRVMEYGWTEEGRLWMAVNVPFLSGQMVVGCPSGFLRFLTGKSFSCYSKDDTKHCGTIAINDKGMSYGYGTYIRQYGIDEGDILSIEFDLTEEKVFLEIADEDILEDVNY